MFGGISVNIKELEAVIEAILFTMGEAVEVERIAAAVEHDEDTIRRLIRNMMTRYEESDRGIHIIELDGSFQLCTRPEMYEYLIKVAHVPKKHVLTDVMLETLSIIAYKQPITRLEIEKIRGVKCVQTPGLTDQVVLDQFINGVVAFDTADLLNLHNPF